MLAIKSFFNATKRFGHSQAGRVAKGLVFIELYALYEYAVTDSVRAALSEMKSRATPLNSIRFELLALVLKPECAAVIDSGRKTLWDKKFELFQLMASPQPMTTPDDAFPDDGSHFRHKQLRTIWRLFGITKPEVPHGRFIPLIGELVTNRNAIAHGRSTAEDTGRRYSRKEISAKIRRTERLCLHIIGTIESHCGVPANLAR